MFEEKQSADAKMREHCEKCGRPKSIEVRESSNTTSIHALLYPSVCACANNVGSAAQSNVQHNNAKTEALLSKSNRLQSGDAPQNDLSLVAQQKLRTRARKNAKLSNVVPRWKKIRGQAYLMIALWLLFILLVILFTPKV